MCLCVHWFLQCHIQGPVIKGSACVCVPCMYWEQKQVSDWPRTELSLIVPAVQR